VACGVQKIEPTTSNQPPIALVVIQLRYPTVMNVPSGLLEELSAALGKKLRTNRAETLLYRYDAIAQGPAPVAVVIAETTSDVARALEICNRYRFAVVPRGGSSGLSGGAVPVGPCVVVATNRMTRLEVDANKRIARAQPGVVTDAIRAAAKPFGLYYAPDPASSRQSTIGGNIAENAGGPQCLKKGVTSDSVLELEFVTADGMVHRMDRSGLDIPGLLIGSEGTLAFVTDAVLKLEPIPQVTRTAFAVFNQLGQAGRAVALITARGLTPAKLELMDQNSIRAVEQFMQIGLPTDAEAILVSDCDGDDASTVAFEIESVADAFREAGAREVRLAQDAAEAAQLWKARRSVSPALGNIRPHRFNEDIVVPRSRLEPAMREMQELAMRYPQFPFAIFGHAGDGNLHPNILFNRRSDDVSVVDEFAHEIARVAIRHGGVLSGEHGIGLMKRGFMTEATPRATLETYWRIKRVFDPNNIINPGKLLPELEPEPEPAPALPPKRTGLGEREHDLTT
jgi:glycolate oxidase